MSRAGIDRMLGFGVGLAVPFALAIQGGGYDIVAHEITSLIVWWVLALGVACRFLPRAGAPQTARGPVLALGFLLAWTGASLLWTSSVELTFDEVARLVGYAGVGLLAFSTLHRDNWRVAAGGLTTAAVAVSVLSVASRIDPSAFSGAASAIEIEGRLGYPLGYWNAMGAWSVMALVLALAWTTNGASPIGRRLAMALVPTIGLSIYLTYSRAGLIGTVVGVLILLALASEPRRLLGHMGIGLGGAVAAILLARTQPEIINASGGAGGGMVAVCLVALGVMCAAFADALARRRIDLPPWRSGSLAVIAVAAAVLVASAKLLPPEHVTVAATRTPGTVQAPSVHNPSSRFNNLSGARGTIWPEAIDAFASEPVLGIGPGTFVYWWDAHQGQPPIRDAHSLYLQELSELGVPGFLAIALVLFGLFAAALHSTRRVRRSPGVAAGLVAAAAVFCVQAAGDWLWKVPALVALATIAVVAAIATVAEPRRVARLRLGGLAFVVLAVLAGAMMVPGIASTDLGRDSADLVAAGRAGEAADYAQAAVTAEPWSASAYAQLAIAEQARDRLREARDAAQQAVELAPQDGLKQTLLGVVDHRLGLDRAAVGRFRAAARLSSGDPKKVTVATVRRAFRLAHAQGLAP